MSKVKTFYPWHSKPQSQGQKHPRRALPEPGSLAAIRDLIRQLENTETGAGAGRARFNFAAAEVAEIYTHKANEGDGVWFRLKNGQIFNQFGEPEGTNTAPFTAP